MEYRMIKTEEVSLLGFGCMRFPEAQPGKIDRAAAFGLLDEAYRRGVNYYDTAYKYHQGESELVLGEWLKTKDRDELYIASKMPMWLVDSLEDAQKIFADQLEKVGIKSFDFYLLHSLDKAKWEKAQELGVLDYLIEQKNAGKIGYLGFSFHDEFPVFEEIIQAYPWDFCQIQLNYVDTEVQAGSKGLALAHSLGIAAVIMEPVKGGLLAGLPASEKALLDGRDEVALALRWVAGQPGVSLILSGMSAKQQVTDNCDALSDPLVCDERELAGLQAVKEALAAKVLVPCSSCEYCLPCPQGVDIPGCFKYLNIGSRYQNNKLAARNYQFNVAENKASKCIECGSCLSKCPQHIDIPKWLKVTAEALENPDED